jgi:hypothetical protein
MTYVPAHMRGPKKSDDAHNHWNYGMTAEEVAEYRRKKREGEERPLPRLVASK